MTVTLKNVDQSLFEVLKSLVKMRQDVEIYEDDDKTASKKNLSKQHIQQINNVYAKIRFLLRKTKVLPSFLLQR